jgi:hypothetical protein
LTALLLRGRRRTFLSLRKHRNYRLFFMGQVVSLSGTWMQNVAMYWFVLTLTHDPFAIGILSICRFGPFTVFGLFSGVIADRFDNRKTVIVTQSVQMVLSAVLAVDALTGHATAWHLYAIAALSGTALVLDAPARQSLTFQMVGRVELDSGVRVRGVGREEDAAGEKEDEVERNRVHRRDRQLTEREAGRADEHRPPPGTREHRRGERADQRAEAERSRKGAEGPRPRVERLLREHRQQDVEVEAEAREDDHHPEDHEHAARVPRVGEALTGAAQERRPPALVEREELGRVHH